MRRWLVGFAPKLRTPALGISIVSPLGRTPRPNRAHFETVAASYVASLNRGCATDPMHPWVLVQVPIAAGGHVVLCDFASAGAGDAKAPGSAYVSWIPVQSQDYRGDAETGNTR